MHGFRPRWHRKPRYLLLDEPTSYLDIGFQIEVLDLIHHLSRDKGIGVIVAIHDINQAMSVSDRIIVLQHGERVFDGDPRTLSESGLIEKVFRVRGRFVELSPQAPPHFDVELARWKTYPDGRSTS